MTVLQAARTLGEESGWTRTPLDYQKILYIAQMIHLDRESRPLFADAFEAWDYGPVVPALYHHLKTYRRNIVTAIAVSGSFAWGTSEAYAISDALCMTQHLKPGQLVNFTHRAGGAWESFYEPAGQNVVIPASAMLAEWRDFTRPSADAIGWAMRMADEVEATPGPYLDDADERAFRARLFGENRA